MKNINNHNNNYNNETDNKIVALENERKILLQSFKKSTTAIQVRIEFAKTFNDLRKLIHVNQQTILHLSDYNGDKRDPYQELEVTMLPLYKFLTLTFMNNQNK